MERSRGFTLIELMIVLTIIAIIAAIALPNLFAARATADETAAIATLRSIGSAQAQFQQGAKADLDNDGMGEYGTFGELASGTPIRPGTAEARPALHVAILSGKFRKVGPEGDVSSTGYYFRIFLPKSDGTGVCPDSTGDFTVLDPDVAETAWVCYAWPLRYGHTGNRTFMLNQQGEIIATDHSAYSGASGCPAPGAGLLLGGGTGSMTGVIATGTTGRDGNLWHRVD